MKKKITALLLIPALALSLCGCSGMFSKEYFNVTEYTDNSDKIDSREVKVVSDWNELKNAVRDMVSRHISEGKLIFSGYGSELQGDLSQVGWSVKSEDALAGYSVDYISYDLNHIVTYYEAQIHITYKRTVDDVNSIIPVAGLLGFKRQVKESLNKCDTGLIAQWFHKGLTEEEVSATVREVYFSDPASCVVSPKPIIRVHNSAAAKNIVELVFNYGYSDAALQTMKAELKRKSESIVSSFDSEDSLQFGRSACEAINSICEYNESLGSTAYSALVEGFADSLGMSLAFTALCNEKGIECTVIPGRLNDAEHYWNAIYSEGKLNHIDVSNYYSLGSEATFMLSDEQMTARGYYWKPDAYAQ